MMGYLILTSRYIIAIAMMLYCLLAFVRLAIRGKYSFLIDTPMSILIFVIQVSAFLTMYIQKTAFDYLFVFAFTELVIFASMTLFVMLYNGMNRLIINNMCMLLGIGLIMMVRLDMGKAFRQLIIAAISIALSLVIPAMIRSGEEFLKRLGFLYALIGIAALLAVLLLGQLTHGSKITFTVAGVTFQPSELVKIIYIFCMAAFLWKNCSFGRILLCGILSAAHVIILVFSKDLGSAVIYYVAFVFTVVFASGKVRYFILGMLGGGAASYAAWRIFTHVQVRVQAWKDPWSVIDSQGYQITQSLFAMARGGWFGLGIGQGTPKDIPYVETDFIFAGVTEEFGLLFGVCLVLVCLTTFAMMLIIAGSTKDRFLSLLASGIGIMYIFQVFLTVGGGTKFIPLTGVTLPLVSYGGSSCLSTLLLFACVQGVSLKEEEDYEKELEQLRRQAANNRRGMTSERRNLR